MNDINLITPIEVISLIDTIALIEQSENKTFVGYEFNQQYYDTATKAINKINQ